MTHWFQTQPHPFRSIQITEWILIGIAVLTELPWENMPYLSTLLGESLVETEPFPFAWLLTLLCLAALGLLGIRLPAGPALSKWAYIAIQFGLILLATTLVNWRSPFLMPYIVVAIRGYLIFRRTARWWVTGLAFGLATTSLVIPLSDVQRIQSELKELPALSLAQLNTLLLIGGISGILLSILVLACMLMLVNALLSERASRQQLAAVHQQLRQYALRIEDQATLQERNRIAQEIHDAVGHNLTAQRIQLENALMFCQSDPQKTETYLQTAQHLAATALTEIRQSVSTLRSDPLKGKPLSTALQVLCREFQNQISGDFIYELHLGNTVKSEVSTTVYRLVQEALTNVAKHSQANQIKLRVKTDFDSLWLMIKDNGIGFDPAQTTAGFGLKSMRERAAAMGGQLQIVTAPGQGCQLSAKLPLAKVML
ncbi:MAG: sensor histidine kinase [Cyanobacteria bacterium J06642_9]